MSRLLDEAIDKARRLPEPDQEALAAIMLQAIESDHRWDELFARPESRALLERMADGAMTEIRAGGQGGRRPAILDGCPGGIPCPVASGSSGS